MVYSSNLNLYGGRSIAMDSSTTFITSMQSNSYRNYGMTLVEVGGYHHSYCMSDYSDTYANRVKFEFPSAQHSKELVSYSTDVVGYFVYANSKCFKLPIYAILMKDFSSR